MYFQQAKQSPKAPSAVTATVFADPGLTRSAGAAEAHGTGELVLPAVGPGTYYLRVSARNSELAQPEHQTYRILIPANVGSLPYHVLLERVPTSS